MRHRGHQLSLHLFSALASGCADLQRWAQAVALLERTEKPRGDRVIFMGFSWDLVEFSGDFHRIFIDLVECLWDFIGF